MTSGRGDGDGGVGRDQHVVLASADSRGFVSLRQPATPRPERYALGRSLRKRVPRSALGDWSVPDNRADPVQQIIATHQGRLDRLIPIRIGRMIASPYAFLRGAAAIMAEDFAHLPSTGITPVICGDAHLGNFGFYAFPDTDGLTVCRALRATGSTVDVIAVTAQRKQTALNTAISLGVMAYLLKPFGFAQMRDTLERYAQYRYAQYPQGLGRSDEIRTLM
jgi:hypothetical protein